MPNAPRIHYDSTTGVLYGLFAAWGWQIFGLGAAIGVIAQDLSISNGLAGLHLTTLSLGAIISGFTADRLSATWGRRRVLVASAALLASGVALLTCGTTIFATLTGTFVTGLAGSLILTSGNAAVFAHQGPAGAGAVNEANAVVTAVGAVAPFATGAILALGGSWRLALGFTIIYALIAGGLLLAIPPSPALDRCTVKPAAHCPGSRLPGLYWLFWWIAMCSVALESSIAAWGPGVLAIRAGTDTATATAAIGLFLAGMTASRMVFGRLALRFAAEQLFVAAYLFGSVGITLFWLSTSSAAGFLALFLTGCGCGGQFPLCLVVAVKVAPAHGDRAMGMINVALGLGSGTIPMSVGHLADHIGTHRAFALLLVITTLGSLLAIAGAVLISRRRTRTCF